VLDKRWRLQVALCTGRHADNQQYLCAAFSSHHSSLLTSSLQLVPCLFLVLFPVNIFQTHLIFLHSPFLEDPEGGGLDAVGGPGGVAALVADGDGEAAEVCPHEVDDPALLALDVQRGALAPVLGPPLRTWSWVFH